MGLITCCDIIVAAETATFGYTEVRLGIEPAIISPFTLPKIGAAFARRYFLTGERFDAHQAARMGLVHEVVSPDELDNRVETITQDVLASAPGAVAIAKRMIREVPCLTREAAHRHTVSTLAQVRVSPEGQEGLTAFLEKRQPRWTQRERD